MKGSDLQLQNHQVTHESQASKEGLTLVLSTLDKIIWKKLVLNSFDLYKFAAHSTGLFRLGKTRFKEDCITVSREGL